MRGVRSGRSVGKRYGRSRCSTGCIVFCRASCASKDSWCWSCRWPIVHALRGSPSTGSGTGSGGVSLTAWPCAGTGGGACRGGGAWRSGMRVVLERVIITGGAAVAQGRLRFGVVGCGRVSRKHLAAITSGSIPAELIAVCDCVEEKARAKAEEYGVPYYVDYHEMMRRHPEIDVLDMDGSLSLLGEEGSVVMGGARCEPHIELGVLGRAAGRRRDTPDPFGRSSQRLRAWTRAVSGQRDPRDSGRSAGIGRSP